MNQTADPCNNFYEFACGGWAEHQSIPPSKARTGTFDQQNERMIAQVRGLLDKMSGEESSTSTNGSLAVKYAGHLYQQCLKAGQATPEEGFKQLHEVVEYVLGRNWNIGQALKLKDEPWQHNFVRSYSYGVQSNVFSIYVGPDSKNVTANIVNVSLAPSILGKVCHFK